MLKGDAKGKLIGLIAGAIHETTPSQEEIRDHTCLDGKALGRGGAIRRRGSCKEGSCKEGSSKSGLRELRRGSVSEDCGNIAATKILVRRR
jgi:hypothetical protein